MKDSSFIFDHLYSLYYKCYKIKLNCGGWYIASPDCIKTKKQQQIPSIKLTINAFNMLQL